MKNDGCLHTALFFTLSCTLCLIAVQLILGGDGPTSGGAASAFPSVEAYEKSPYRSQWEKMCTAVSTSSLSFFVAKCQSLPKTLIKADRNGRSGNRRSGASSCRRRTDVSNEETTKENDDILDLIILTDALRPDMLLSPMRFPFFNTLVEQGLAHVMVPIASPPTVTLPKVKTILTGKDASFVDLLTNFAAPQLTISSVLHRAVMQTDLHESRCLGFYGDDTWLKLFPVVANDRSKDDHHVGFTSTPREDEVFVDAHGIFSFDVNDYTHVDNNVTAEWRRIFSLPPQKGGDASATKSALSSKSHLRKDGLILHYLGLDHIGHTLGPQSEVMLKKQQEMDHVVFETLYKQMCVGTTSHPVDSTLRAKRRIVLLSDHGMARVGGHGGSTNEEVETVLGVIRCQSKDADAALETDNGRGDTVPLSSSSSSDDDYDELELKVNKHHSEPPSSISVGACNQVDVAAALTVLFQHVANKKAASNEEEGPENNLHLHPDTSMGLIPLPTLRMLHRTNDDEGLLLTLLSNIWHLLQLAVANGSGDEALHTTFNPFLEKVEESSGDKKESALLQLHRDIGLPLQQLLLHSAGPSSEDDEITNANAKDMMSVHHTSAESVILAHIHKLKQPSSLQMLGYVAGFGVAVPHLYSRPVLVIVCFLSSVFLLGSSFSEEEHLLVHGIFYGAITVILGGLLPIIQRIGSCAGPRLPPLNRMLTHPITAAILCVAFLRVGFGWAHSGTKWMALDVMPSTMNTHIISILKTVLETPDTPLFWEGTTALLLWSDFVSSKLEMVATPIGLVVDRSVVHIATLILMIVMLFRLVGRKRGFVLSLVLVVAPINAIVPLLCCWMAAVQFKHIDDFIAKHPAAVSVYRGDAYFWPAFRTIGWLMLHEAAFYAPGRSILLANLRFDHVMPYHTHLTAVIDRYVYNDTDILRDATIYCVLGPLLLVWQHAGRVVVLVEWAAAESYKQQTPSDKQPASTETTVPTTVVTVPPSTTLYLRHALHLAALVVICCGNREHLFYWTVFLPKLLFAVVDVVYVLVASLVLKCFASA